MPHRGFKPAYTEQTLELHLATAVHIHRQASIGGERETGRQHDLTFLESVLYKQTTVSFAADFCLA